MTFGVLVRTRRAGPRAMFDPHSLIMSTALIFPCLAVLTTSAHAIDKREKLNVINLLIPQVQRCWSPPAASGKAEKVRVRFKLNPDGTLKEGPTIDPSQPPVSTAASEAALRAVRRCSPLNLPPESYEYWREVMISFDATPLNLPDPPPRLFAPPSFASPPQIPRFAPPPASPPPAPLETETPK